MYGALLKVRDLPPGADLKRIFVAAILEWIDAGWQLKEFSSRTGRLSWRIVRQLFRYGGEPQEVLACTRAFCLGRRGD